MSLHRWWYYRVSFVPLHSRLSFKGSFLLLLLPNFKSPSVLLISNASAWNQALSISHLNFYLPSLQVVLSVIVREHFTKLKSNYRIPYFIPRKSPLTASFELKTKTHYLPISRVDLLEKAMAPQSSTLVWKIPWMEEPGRLWSMGSLRVRHDWVTSLALFTFMHWRRKWQPTPVFLPGECQRWGSLVGCYLWGRRVRHDWRDLAAAAAPCIIMSKIFFFLPKHKWLCRALFFGIFAFKEVSREAKFEPKGIPEMGEPGGLLSMGLHRVGHN